MAVSMPGNFLPTTPTVHPFRPREDAEHKTWRLPSNHIADLRDVARGVEETNAGVCCRYLVDQFSGAGHSDIDNDGYVNHLDAVERFCDQYGVWKHPSVITWRRRIERARRAIVKMHLARDHKHVCVLHVVYGYPDPMTLNFPKKVLDVLGELVSLARYTDIVEVKRQEMARQEAAKVAASRQVSKEFEPDEEVSRVAIRQNLPAAYGPMLVDLMKHRDLYERSLRIITSADALRLHIAPAPDKQKTETEEHYRERREATEVRRDVFISQVRIECDKLLVAASKAYHSAWLASGG